MANERGERWNTLRRKVNYSVCTWRISLEWERVKGETPVTQMQKELFPLSHILQK